MGHGLCKFENSSGHKVEEVIMGLMYVFPVKEDDLDDRIETANEEITLKTYGLPMIFWGYLLSILVVIFAMSIVIKAPLVKLISTGDPLNIFLGWIVALSLILSPLSLFSFFFYEKWIKKSKNTLSIYYKIFYFTFFKKTYQINSKDPFEIRHHLDSPNIAKMNKRVELRGFENQGYFEIYFKDEAGKYHFLDRNSRKADLKKIQSLLEQY